MVDLSVIVPSVRPDRQHDFVQSVYRNCTKYNFELVFVGPELVSVLNTDTAVKHVKDYGCPSRCMNIGAAVAEGKYITWSADDGIHENNGFDKILDILENGYSDKDVVVAKYKEGDDIVHNDDYYRLNNAYPRSPHISDNWWIFNLAFMHRKYYKKLGGCDSNFQTSAVTLADLAVRAQRDGAQVTMFGESTVKFGLMPVDTGDHGPVFRAQMQEDMPNYENLHTNPLMAERICIGFENWHFADRVWGHRW
jgi:hypothetical protein